MDVTTYLRRIRYAGVVSQSQETLRGMHRAHLESVPFENLDIFLGREISIDENAVVRKVVEERRGGFCYELNGAFAALLRAIGFQVTLLSAQVAREDGTYSPEYDHLALLVHLDQLWLADVGFGEGFLEPLILDKDLEQEQSEGTYCVRERDGLWTVERLQTDKLWKPQYSFTLRVRELHEFAARCHFHQTSSESHFTQKRLCTLATPTGRITLSNLKLLVTRNGFRQEHVLASEEEWREVLRERFGVIA
jgi:N-hydroxyarylamine O-acetyltransferase